jgi:hypothetical protein
MKPIDERCQAATKVNAISPEIVDMEEADSFQASGRQDGYTHKWREYNHFLNMSSFKFQKVYKITTYVLLLNPLLRSNNRNL